MGGVRVMIALLVGLLIIAAPVVNARNVLVLGGTQFMGRHMIESLLKTRKAGDTIAMLNRGVSTNPFAEDVEAGRLLHLKCDRMGDSDDRERFRTLVAKTVDFWDVIVDFIAFHAQFARDSVLALHRSKEENDGSKSRWKVGTYVHISTTSVYQAMPLPQDHARPLTEDCCAPLKEGTPEWDAHQKLAGRTGEGRYQLRYGGNKLTVDTFYQHVWKKGRFPFVSLRIPDVYGPYDNLGGFWQNFVAPVLRRKRVSVFLPPERIRPRGKHKDLDDFLSHKMSWVFAPDVIRAVEAVVALGPAAHGKILNIAHTEHVSATELAGVVADQLNKISPDDEATYEVHTDERSLASQPQDDIGPIDVSRALALLDGRWAPMALADGVAHSIAWFLADEKNRQYAGAVQKRLKAHDAVKERKKRRAGRKNKKKKKKKKSRRRRRAERGEL